MPINKQTGKPQSDHAEAERKPWRVGAKVPLNVYDGGRPVCQCQTPEDAARIATAMNQQAALEELLAAAETARRKLKYIAYTELTPTIEWRESAGEMAEALRAAIAKCRGLK